MTHTTTLRYEGFTVGQRIRALDFAPREGRGACAIEGPITHVFRDGSPGHQYAHYVVAVERDIWQGHDVEPAHSRVGTPFCVPMESSLDYDGRVTFADQLDRATKGDAIETDRDEDAAEERYFRRQEQAREVHYPDTKGHPDEEY